MTATHTNLRVLFHTLDWAFQTPGGGEVQLLQTRRALEDLGVTIDLFDRWQSHIADYPLLHSFGIFGHRFWGAVKSAGTTLAVSTVLWPASKRGLGGRLRSLAIRFAERRGWATPGEHRPPFELVDLVLPNSQAEADLLTEVYGISPGRIHVVPNGVEERFASAQPQAFLERYGLEGFVLCVGAFEGRKNQLTAIRALRNCDVQVVFLGQARLGSEAYYEQCRSEAGPNMHFLGQVAHDDPLLESAYAAAGVLLMPSILETPGLVALEAALAGTPVVITPGGCTREYFADLATYVSPQSEQEIRDAALRTLQSPPETSALQERVRSHFLWKHAAEATLAGYHKVLARRS